MHSYSCIYRNVAMSMRSQATRKLQPCTSTTIPRSRDYSYFLQRNRRNCLFWPHFRCDPGMSSSLYSQMNYCRMGVSGSVSRSEAMFGGCAQLESIRIHHKGHPSRLFNTATKAFHDNANYILLHRMRQLLNAVQIECETEEASINHRALPRFGTLQVQCRVHSRRDGRLKRRDREFSAG